MDGGEACVCRGQSLAPLAVAGTALGDIGGTVTSLGGIPLEATIEVRDAPGAVVATTTSNGAGLYSVPTGALTGKTGPFRVRAIANDPCRVAPELSQRIADVANVADGTTQNLSVDVLGLCAAGAPTGLPEPSAFVDATGGAVLAGAGGIAYVRTPIPSGATGVQVRLGDGTVVSQSPPVAGLIPIVGPTAPHSGPLTLSYLLGGTPVARPLASLTSGRVRRPPARRTLDVAAAVPLTGTQFFDNGDSEAQEWIGLLARLSRRADGFGAFGYDTIARPVADIGPVQGKDDIEFLEELSRATLTSVSGQEDLNVAVSQARRLFGAPGQNGARRKLFALISASSSFVAPRSYLNEHLRLGLTESGAPWPVCAIQAGRGIDTAKRTRMRRIALETGGRFLSAPRTGDVPDRLLQCRAAAAGERTLLGTTTSLRRRTRTLRFRARARRHVTILLSAGRQNGAQLSLVDPRGRVRTLARTGGLIFTQGQTYTLVTIPRAIAGRWSIRVGARRAANSIGVRVVST